MSLANFQAQLQMPQPDEEAGASAPECEHPPECVGGGEMLAVSRDETKPLTGKPSLRTRFRFSLRTEHGALPPWVVLFVVIVLFCCSDLLFRAHAARHITVPEFLPKTKSVPCTPPDCDAMIAVKSVKKKVKPGDKDYLQAVFHTAFRAYIEGRGTERTAEDAFNAYVGDHGGLREQELLAWLKFCHEPPENEKDDLDATFDEIDVSHTQYITFKDLEKEMQQRWLDSGSRGCM